MVEGKKGHPGSRRFEAEAESLDDRRAVVARGRVAGIETEGTIGRHQCRGQLLRSPNEGRHLETGCRNVAPHGRVTYPLLRRLLQFLDRRLDAAARKVCDPTSMRCCRSARALP